MITLSQRLKRKSQNDEQSSSNRASIRDRLLVKEAQEMSQLLPSCCTVNYASENDLGLFTLIVKPTEGFWEGGTFKFEINVTEEYNMVVSTLRCFYVVSDSSQTHLFALHCCKSSTANLNVCLLTVADFVNLYL